MPTQNSSTESEQDSERLHSAGSTSEPTLLRIASTLLRHRILILRCIAFGALLGGLFALVIPRTYTSDFSFTPQEATPKEGLSALASDLGVNVGGVASQSPAFYVDLLKTRKVLASLTEQRFSYTSNGRQTSIPLAETLLGPSSEPRVHRLEAV